MVTTGPLARRAALLGGVLLLAACRSAAVTSNPGLPGRAPCKWDVVHDVPVLSEVQFLSPDRAVAIDGTCVWETRDGGHRWTRLHCHEGGSLGTEMLHHLVFTSAASGWLVAGARPMHTADGGKTWRAQPPGDDILVRSVRFVDSERGWLAGEQRLDGVPDARGVIYRTTDSGRHWSEGRVAVTEAVRWRLEDIWPISDDVVWAVGDYLLHSSDGGISWQPAPIDEAKLLELRNVSIRFLDHNLGIIQRSPPRNYLLTRDGGRQWLESAMPGELAGVVLWTGAQDGWAAAGHVYHSADGGNTWQRVLDDSLSPPGRVAYRYLQFLRAENLLIALGDHTIATCTPSE
jgi:photosystem II stability/assembly factor-like uncharacterized protein